VLAIDAWHPPPLEESPTVLPALDSTFFEEALSPL
jgi:hypothetical protein